MLPIMPIHPSCCNKMSGISVIEGTRRRWNIIQGVLISHRIRCSLERGKSMSPPSAPFNSGLLACFIKSNNILESKTEKQNTALEWIPFQHSIYMCTWEPFLSIPCEDTQFCNHCQSLLVHFIKHTFLSSIMAHCWHSLSTNSRLVEYS